MRKIVELMFVISFITFVYCANAVDRFWNNTGTDFNDGASWIGGTAPGKNDRAYFYDDMAIQPYLTASTTLHSLFLTPASGTSASDATSAAGGYVLSGSPGTTLTLTSTGHNHGGVYMMEQCTTGTNVIDVGLGLPDRESLGVSFINLRSGVLEISGSITGNSNNVLRAGGEKIIPTLILSGDNTGFTGGFVKAAAHPVYIRNSKSVYKLTQLIFEIHGSSAVASNRFINDTGAELVFENNPQIIFRGGDGVVFEGDCPFDLGNGTIVFDDGDTGRNCPLYINAPLVRMLGDITQERADHGLVKLGKGTLEIGGKSSCERNLVVGDGVLLVDDFQAISPLAALNITRHSSSVSGGIIGLAYGDFTMPLGEIPGGFYSGDGGGYSSWGGWAAYGGDRNVNIGGDLQAVTNAKPFMTQITLGSPTADGTVTFLNPLHTANSKWTCYKGAADVDGRFAGAITNYNGTWSTITKYGDGILELSADNPLTGRIDVYEGVLLVSGSVRTQMNAKSGGALGGNGTFLSEITIENNGAFYMDDRFGTATVSGELKFNDGAKIRLLVDGSDAAGIQFAGTYKKISNLGNISCTIEAATDDVTIGTIKLIDWSDATSPNISSLDPEKFSIENDEEFAGTFSIRDNALVLVYRNLQVQPACIIIR
jgi:autotransporter-associated beta strand protein